MAYKLVRSEIGGSMGAHVEASSDTSTLQGLAGSMLPID